MDGLLSRLDRTEKNNSDLECTYGKNYHNAGQKYGKTKTMENEWLKDMWNFIRFLKGFPKERIERIRKTIFKEATNENFTELKT